jgi:predicted DNA-binding transcriptional regulator YafY
MIFCCFHECIPASRRPGKGTINITGNLRNRFTYKIIRLQKILRLKNIDFMPKNKNAYLRYLHIHSQIKRNKFKKGYPTKQDLLYYLEEEEIMVSPSTLEKDLNFLRIERNAPLVYDTDQKCYRYTDDWEFDMPLTPDAVRMLDMVIRKLQLFGESQEFRAIRDTIDRLSDHFELTRQHSKDYLGEYILFEYTKGYTGGCYLPLVYDAIFDSREITFTHTRFDTNEKTFRSLQPYVLKEHRNRWYVIGKEDGVPKIFGIERISDLSIMDKWFEKDVGFYDEVKSLLFDSVGVMAFGFDTEEVVLKFERSQAQYIKTLMLHRSQQIIEDNESGLTVSLKVKITPEFIMDCILRYGKDVKVLQPESLVKKVKENYNSALLSYEKR